MLIRLEEEYIKVAEYLFQKLIGEAKETALYYAFLDIPPFWSIKADGPGGIICHGEETKARVFFSAPEIERNVDHVEWIDENKKVWRIDHFGCYGYKYCSEFLCNGVLVVMEYYSDKGILLFSYRPGKDEYLMYDKGQLYNIVHTTKALLSDFFDEDRAFQKDSLIVYETLILTNTDNIRSIESIIKEFPNVVFHIGADTLMSDKLMQLPDLYRNVQLYPCISNFDRHRLMRESEFYFDITKGVELEGAIREAIESNCLVMGYEDTVRRPELMLADTIVGEESAFSDLLYSCIGDEEKYLELLEQQSSLLMG